MSFFLFLCPCVGGTIKLLVAITEYIIEDNTVPSDTGLFTNSQLNILVCNYTATLSITGK